MPITAPLLLATLLAVPFVPPRDDAERRPAGDLDAAFAEYWSAATATERDVAARAILATDAEFDAILGRLRAGRPYRDDVRRGTFFVEHTIDGMPHYAMLMVPKRYDPARPMAVRMELHGGMGQVCPEANDGSWQQAWADIEDYDNGLITVLPAGCWDSMWWERAQHEHLHTLLAELRRDYNVDTDRVLLCGSSDGCVALFFYAFRDAATWAAYVGTVGFPARLTNPAMRPDGQMHLSNLRDQALLLWNGVRDHIVNIGVVREYVDVMRAAGARLDAREHPRDGHALRLSDDEDREFGRLLGSARRDPLPDRLSWATERTDRYNRHSWLVIEELVDGHPIDATNILPRITGPNVPDVPPLAPQPWGRVELERDGNTIRATTVGVRRFRLLLAPDEFDFGRPLRLELDGELHFEGTLRPDAALLLHWAARDDDRSRLFGAQLEVVVPDEG